MGFEIYFMNKKEIITISEHLFLLTKVKLEYHGCNFKPNLLAIAERFMLYAQLYSH